ncbi:NTP transferase domain-containing protein [Methylomonas sp. HYX-M1]|uniref:nucleotidyltransferase family protein n=1 Tax=Methylomonas sp. HYX-M1 TaxID=3139307 RepID=UPI00345BBC7F
MLDVTGILLAAGSATRFGADKLLHPLTGDETVASQACRRLLHATGSVIAVVRQEDKPLAERLLSLGATVAFCAQAERGLSASLACGVAAAPASNAVLIALADMPWIQPASIAAIARAMYAGAWIAAPAYRGRRGHPVGFSPLLRAELLGLTGDQGAKPVLQNHDGRVTLIDCDDPGVLLDIDTPADLLQTPLNDHEGLANEREFGRSGA